MGMRKIIPLALMALTLMGGTALADRGRWDRDTSHRAGGTTVRDSRWRGDHRDRDRRVYRNYDRDRRVYRQYDRDRYRRRVVVQRRPVYANNGRFVFGGNYYRAYSRPVIRQRYYDYRYRPQIVVENYDPVPGYIWVRGSWSWNGYEWIWTAGHYEPDPQYQQWYGYDSNGDGYADDYNYDPNYQYNY